MPVLRNAMAARICALMLLILSAAMPALADATAAGDDAQWRAALAEAHALRRAAVGSAEVLALAPTASPVGPRARLEKITGALLNGAFPGDLDATAGWLPVAQRRWMCLAGYRMRIAGAMSGLTMVSAPHSATRRAYERLRDLEPDAPDTPGCAGLLAEAGDGAALARLIRVEHIGARQAVDSPCLYQGTVLEVERGRGEAGKPASFDHDCALSGGPGRERGIYRVRTGADGQILTVERLDKGR